jgi:hypothetical protein
VFFSPQRDPNGFGDAHGRGSVRNEAGLRSCSTQDRGGTRERGDERCELHCAIKDYHRRPPNLYLDCRRRASGIGSGRGVELENTGIARCGLVIMAARPEMWVRLIMAVGLVEGAADGEGAAVRTWV